MQGDISRSTFRPARHYSRVVMQQGRMQLDADWNEQAAIQDERFATFARDVVGLAGGPRGHSMMLVNWHSLCFDGTGHVEVSEDPVFGFEARRQFTIECFALPRARGGPLITWLDGTGDSGWRLDVDEAHRVTFARAEAREIDAEEILAEDGYLGDVQVRAAIADIEVPMIVRTLRTQRALPAGVFSHVAVTFDGRQTRIYIDAELAAVDARAGRALGRGGTLVFGGAFVGLCGELSDVAIWGECTPAWALGTRRAAGASDRLGWWPMDDEGDAGTIRDDSGRGHPGRIVYGPAGSPVRCNRVWVGRGRYYVGGLLCENSRPVPLDAQPDLPSDRPTPGDQEPEHALAVIDAWEQYVSAIQDPQLAESALGGPDTAGRLRTVWQVRRLPLAKGEIAHAVKEAWHNLLHAAVTHGRLRARYVATGRVLGNHLYRVEIHDGPLMWPSDHAATARVDTVDVAARRVRLRADQHVFDWTPGHILELLWRDIHDVLDQRIEATVTAVDDRWLTLDPWPTNIPEGGYLHARRLSTFKWSRDNGAIAFPLLRLDAQTGEAIVGMGGRSELPLQPGDWVEVGDDRNGLLERPGVMARVQTVVASDARMTLAGIPEGTTLNPARHPYVRKWDQSAETNTSGVLPVRLHSWIPLERGVEVAFVGDGLYRPTDYWLIPSRTTTGVEWPTDDALPAALRPHGPRHAFAPLGRLRIDRHGTVVDESYVRTFGPANQDQST